MLFRRVGVAAVVLGVVIVVGALALLGPYVMDDLALDRAVRASALDWRDFGLDTARTRLQYELDRQHIGLQVSDDDCAFTESEGVREVRCAWRVEAAVPAVGWKIPLGFESRARILPDGDLR